MHDPSLIADVQPRSRIRLSSATVRVSFLRSPAVFVGAVGLSVVMLAVGELTLPIAASFWLIAVLVTACAVGLALTEPRRDRVVSFNLFALAIVLRVAVLLACTEAAIREGGPFLGPDSTGYFTGAIDLAQRGFHLDTVPPAFFGSYDVSHYYLFAAAITFLHANLFALQMLNIGLTALAAPLTFSIAKGIVPRAARAIGLCVAAYPSLIVLSAVDLLKDPSVVCATLIATWAILRMARARHARTVVLAAIPGVIALVYLRTGRFYSFAYLEAAAVLAAAWVMVHRRTCIRTWTAVVVLLAAFGAAELLPTAGGWPTSPALFASQVEHVLGTPIMRTYSIGLVDRFGARSTHATVGGQPAPSGRLTEPGPRQIQKAISFVANLIRRIFGPFPWILPELWSLRYLQAGDFLLYPSMLVWYAMLPLIVGGLFSAGCGLARQPRFFITFLWLFAVLYFLQYLTLNLSYRQREVMVPVLVVFAAVGILPAARARTFPRWYAAYCVLLVAMAAGHLAFRGWLA